MEKIYIAFVDTPGLFASALHGYLKQKYIHVLLSLDENLDEAYSCLLYTSPSPRDCS